jgi:hypothetical protein
MGALHLMRERPGGYHRMSYPLLPATYRPPYGKTDRDGFRQPVDDVTATALRNDAGWQSELFRLYPDQSEDVSEEDDTLFVIEPRAGRSLKTDLAPSIGKSENR